MRFARSWLPRRRCTHYLFSTAQEMTKLRQRYQEERRIFELSEEQLEKRLYVTAVVNVVRRLGDERSARRCVHPLHVAGDLAAAKLRLGVYFSNLTSSAACWRLLIARPLVRLLGALFVLEIGPCSRQSSARAACRYLQAHLLLCSCPQQQLTWPLIRNQQSSFLGVHIGS